MILGRLGIWATKQPVDYAPLMLGTVPARPMAGFVTVTGHFIYRAGGREKQTLCGRTVEDAITPGAKWSEVSCTRCQANVAKWHQRAPHLAR